MKEKEEAILHQLRKYPWKKVFYETSIFDDENFYFERKYTKYQLERYVGEFKNDLKHGRGLYIWRDGKTYNGEWKNGKMDGKGEFYWPNGSIYRGQYEKDEKHGQGIMMWNINSRYRGFWAFGVRHGYGEAIDIEGDKMTITGGLWVKDRLRKKQFTTELDLKNIRTDE